MTQYTSWPTTVNGATPVGAWAGVNTATAMAAPRFSRASRSSSRIARMDIGRSLASTTTRRSCPRAARASTVRTKSPFLDLRTAPASRPVPSSRSPAPRAISPSIAPSSSSKSRALRRRPGALRATGRGCRLDGDETLLEALEPGRDLLAELVHRRVEAGGVEEVGELGRIAIEVALQHPADPPDGAVALGLVEQLVHHGPQRAAVTEELLQGARQPTVPIGEVGAQRLLEGLGGTLVDLLCLADHPLELGPDRVDVDRHARVLERDQADAQGPLDERTPIPRRALPQERGEGRVRQGQAVDDDPVALEPDRRVERDDGGFHAPDTRTHP